MIWITEAKYYKEYQIWVKFNDNKEMIVDLTHHLDGEIYKPLNDKKFFSKVKLNRDTDTIEWSNGADYAPEFLYGIGKEIPFTVK
ncbi:MAG: hypothetical protein IEMM0008_0274 [bacterium]|nr:MAG: hypothetical protein IEMM0008_0274 [bacterium]